MSPKSNVDALSCSPAIPGWGWWIALLCVLSMTGISLAGTGTRHYEYDELGRIVLVELPNGSVIEYTYDAAGNILSTQNIFPDGDGDGVPDVSDCAPGDAAVFPGAAEINDGKDNQCPGDPGHGLIDEIMGPLVFTSPTTLSWPAQPGATMYEIARSSAATFATGCAKLYSPVASFEVGQVPGAGSAHCYLVRPYLPHAGSWGARSDGVERTVCP
jgi:YD repeat-containing protein